jgi:ATP-binding cassette subfamily B protein
VARYQKRIQQALTDVMQGRTTIVLEHGRLVEQGTHASLMADPNSAYARFHRVQGRNGLGLVDDGKPIQTVAHNGHAKKAVGRRS